MSRLIKFPFYLAKVLGQVFKSDRVPYHLKAALSKYHQQANLTWRLVGNQTVKSKLNGKVVGEKARFFVPKPYFYSSENVGKSLEKFKSYIESKGFKISFDFVKLALVGVALNRGANDLAFNALHDSFLQDLKVYKDCENEGTENTENKDEEYASGIVYARTVENGFEEIYIKEQNEIVENNDNIKKIKEIENNLNNDDQNKETDNVANVSDEDFKMGEDGILINFEKLNKNEKIDGDDKEDGDGSDDEFNKRLMHLLMLYLTENNEQLKQMQQTQQQFDEYLERGVVRTKKDGEVAREIKDGEIEEENNEIIKAENKEVVKEKDEELIKGDKKYMIERKNKGVESKDVVLVSDVGEGGSSLEKENDQLRKDLSEKVDEIAELKKQMQLLKLNRQQSGNDGDTFVLESGSGGDNGGDKDGDNGGDNSGEETFRRPWNHRN